MSDSEQASLCAEIERRIANTRKVMSEQGYDALIVYGNNKVYGSLRYLSGYFPDRAGWISLSGTDTFLFDGAVLVLPSRGDPVLLLEPGLKLVREVCTQRVIAGGVTAGKDDSLSAKAVAGLLREVGATGTVGVETWDRFPTPLYLGLKELLPKLDLRRSTIVEELRMVKSPLEIAEYRKASMVGDLGHAVFVEQLRQGIGKTELELTRPAEEAMRRADPIYEDSCNTSPSFVCSGLPIAGAYTHLPDNRKTIQLGDAVLWDICMRHNGCSIDTSRTKVVGRASEEQKRAYAASLVMFDEVLKAAKPGVSALALVKVAERVAKESGFEWSGFLGHGIGLDCHERPELFREDTPLAGGMIFAVEPKLVVDKRYLLGVEDAVLITSTGGESLNHFEKMPLEL